LPEKCQGNETSFDFAHRFLKEIFFSSILLVSDKTFSSAAVTCTLLLPLARIPYITGV
jgi:hypothetical protein